MWRRKKCELLKAILCTADVQACRYLLYSSAIFLCKNVRLKYDVFFSGRLAHCQRRPPHIIIYLKIKHECKLDFLRWHTWRRREWHELHESLWGSIWELRRPTKSIKNGQSLETKTTNNKVCVKLLFHSSKFRKLIRIKSLALLQVFWFVFGATAPSGPAPPLSRVF